MCGIAGIWNIKGAQIERSRIENAINLINHRGPDADGIEFLDNNSLVLGHKRLSILDLSNLGNQPMYSANKRYCITYNGEVYNYLVLKNELIDLGHKFISNTDTEVLLVLFELYGKSMVHKLEGMFSFAIYDIQNNELFCARDAFGVKPFFYIFQNNEFSFNSSIYALFKTTDINFTINENSLIQNLCFDMCFRPATMFNEINALPKGSYLTLDTKNGISIHKYYTLPLNTKKNNITLNEATEKLDKILTDSVAQQLISDVEVATFMSGGLDSSIITAIASKINPEIKAFTLGFEDNIDALDEIENAEIIAKHLNINHVIYKTNASEILPFVEPSIWFSDEPLGGIPPSYILAKKVNDEKIKVVLNGLGGDELFAGYMRYNFDEYNWYLRSKQGKIKRLLSKFVKIKHSYFPSYYLSTLSRFSEKEIELITNNKNNILDCFIGVYGDTNRNNLIDNVSNYDMQFYLGEYQLDGVDQLTMAYSIEGRFPFLNKALVEFAYSLSNEFKHNGVGKIILKKLAERYLPKEVINAPKKGFGMPNSKWFEPNQKLGNYAFAKIEKLKQRKQLKHLNLSDEIYNNHRAKFVALELWFEKFYG